MKELESIQKDKQEISVQKKQQKEKELIGQIKPKPGHRIFEINTETGKVQEATFTQEINFSLTGKNNKQIFVQPKCIYISALNKKNAVKHYTNHLKRLVESAQKPVKLLAEYLGVANEIEAEGIHTVEDLGFELVEEESETTVKLGGYIFKEL